MELILVIFSIIGLVYGLYFAFTSVAGLLVRRKPSFRRCPPTRRIAAIIAARNEAEVIGPLVRSLMAQKYPRELYDVYVVPNNCTDNTEAAARAEGARILHCTGPIHSKGDALRCAFDQLSQLEDRYDTYCIFDADNLVDEMFFQAVNDAREAGYRVAQGYRDSKNPYDNWISGCMSSFYWFMSRFYNASRSALGMSAALNGTGFMVADDVIREIGWETVTLTEDLEFSALCSLADVKIGWMPNARFFDEQPNTFCDSIKQRRRWSAGSIQCLKRYGIRLFKKGTSHSIDIGILFVGMLLNLAGAASVVLTACILIRQIVISPESAPLLLLTALISILGGSLTTSLGCLVMFLLEKKLTLRALPAILLFGPFMATWMLINIASFFTNPPKWDAIRHTSKHVVSG